MNAPDWYYPTVIVMATVMTCFVLWTVWKDLMKKTGLQSLLCRLFHARHHRLQQVEYGGGYLCRCEKCGECFFVQR